MRATTQLTRASRPFSLNQTGTLLRRHLAQFVAVVDTLEVSPPRRRRAEGPADSRNVMAGWRAR
jgi:hypothetical protein